MRAVLALTAGVLVALVPTSSALAGDVPGKAYGNCKHSSSVGNPHSALLPAVGHGKGNGGLVELAKSGAGCAVAGVDPAPTGPVVPSSPPSPTDPTDPAPPPVADN